MDDLNNKTDDNTTFNQSFESTYLTIEQILYSNGSNAREKSTAWRQQSLLINKFSDTNNNDLLERLCNHQNALMDHATLDKHLNNVRSLISPDFKFQTDTIFPNIDEISLPLNQEQHHDMLRSEFPNYGNQMVNFITKPSSTIEIKSFAENDENTCKPRNAMQNLLKPTTVKSTPAMFTSARQLLAVQTMKKNVQSNGFGCQRNANNIDKTPEAGFNFAATKKSLGSLGRVVNSNRKNFVSPVRCTSTSIKDNEPMKEIKIDAEMESLLSHPALKNVDFKMVELITNEIIHSFHPVDWNEIAGLEYAKSIIKEAVVYPLLRPDIFTGLRRPPRGILLFGPPGTGKTLIGKCIASQSSSTFFSISSASLTSKWMGDGEKMVRALFAVAVARQPSVIFIDEIDSLLSQRSESENEGTRRLKTEFLVRLDGAATTDDDRVLIVGATNRPQELDEAVRRRFVKRLYVPLPELEARTEILTNLLKSVDNNLNANELKEISQLADGYSGADMDSLCREASMEPLRSLPAELIITFNKENLRPINTNDFHSALKKIRPSVSQKDLAQYVDWNKTYGSSY